MPEAPVLDASAPAPAKVDEVKKDPAAPAPTPEPAKVPEPAKTEPEVKPEAKKDEPKKGEEPPKEVKKVVPEKYDLKLPEGSKLDASAIEKVASFAKEKGLSNEEAQMLVDRESQAIAGYVSSIEAGLKVRAEKWTEELKADKDFGGDAFPKNAETVKRFVKAFADEKFLDDLDNTRMGNHPGLFRMLARAAKKMSPDTFERGVPKNDGGKKRPEDILYDAPPAEKQS